MFNGSSNFQQKSNQFKQKGQNHKQILRINFILSKIHVVFYFIFLKCTFGLHYCFILGTVYTTNYNSKLHCCGNNVYYSTTQLCCENGSTIEKTLPDHTSCCKKNATSFYSCKNQEKKKSDFCGRQSYDKKSDLCCNNEIHRGAHKMGKRCCNPGTLAYDPRNQICCHGEVKRIAERQTFYTYLIICPL